VPYSSNGQARTWTYTYGAAGQLLTVDGPLAGTDDMVTYTYTAAGHLASVTTKTSAVATANLVTAINTVNGRGQPTQITDPNGVVTNLAYNTRNRLTTITVNPSAGPAVTSIAYDAIGQITRITRPDGSYLNYTYNNGKQLTTVTNTTGETINYTRNLAGGITATNIKAANGTTITFQQTQTFDELGRLLRHIGAANQTTAFAYEKNDNLKTVTDPRSGVYSYAYDSLNRLIRETDQENAQVNYTLDGQGQVATYADPRNLQTVYSRNGFGEVKRRASPDSGNTDTVYDARGLATQITDGRGIVTSMTYDAAGRILTKTYPAATAENVTYTYDDVTAGNKGKGRLTRIASQNVTIDRVYDVRGNIVTDTRTIAGLVHTTSYLYDGADRVTQITYPSGRIVAYVRDSARDRSSPSRDRESPAPSQGSTRSERLFLPRRFTPR
jgi:YD repeat-containing protein